MQVINLFAVEYPPATLLKVTDGDWAEISSDQPLYLNFQSLEHSTHDMKAAFMDTNFDPMMLGMDLSDDLDIQSPS
jgi:hypothetical protein